MAYISKTEKLLQLGDQGFRRNSSLEAVCDTSIARTTGFIGPREGNTALIHVHLEI